MGVRGRPSCNMNAGEFGEAGTSDTYLSQASAGHAGDPGILGRDKTAGFVPLFIVFDERMTTTSPAIVDVISALHNVWGPCHNVAAGDRRLEARRKAKKPTHRAATIGAACMTPCRY